MRWRAIPGGVRISCDYAVRAHVLPGLWRTLHFTVDVDQPYIAEPEPIIF